MNRRTWLRLLACLAVLFAVAWPTPARALADGPASGETPPRDVSLIVQPSAAPLPEAPADFLRVDGGWLTIELPSSVRERAETLVREADDIRARLAEDFGQPVLDRATVRIARTPEQMAELAPRGAPPPAYAAGVAYPSVHLALLALKAPDTWDAPDLVELLQHELTHLALAEAVAGHHVPRWFDEGLAIRESGEVPWARRMTLWNSTLSKRLIPLADLDLGFPTDRYEVNGAYAESADFVAFLMRDADRARFGSLVQRVRAGAAFDRALEDAYGADARKLEYEWREELGRRFGVVPMLTSGGIVWVLIMGLMGAAWVKRRRRAKAKLAQWAREEAETDAVAAAARAELERATQQPPRYDEAPPHVPAIPVVEHEGRWYTVH
jgi:hypothetical protein